MKEIKYGISNFKIQQNFGVIPKIITDVENNCGKINNIVFDYNNVSFYLFNKKMITYYKLSESEIKEIKNISFSVKNNNISYNTKNHVGNIISM